LPRHPSVPLRSRKMGRRAVGPVARPALRRERAADRAEYAWRAPVPRRRSLRSRLEHRPHRDRAARERGLHHDHLHHRGEEPHAPRARVPAPAADPRSGSDPETEKETLENMKPISTPEAPAAIGTYSQAVHAGDTVYLSGQIPLDPKTMQLVEGFEAQVKRVFDNLRAVCRAAGGDFDKVVRVTVYLTDLGNFAKVNEAMATYFKEP